MSPYLALLLRRRRRRLLIVAATALSGYSLYRLYHLPSLTRHRRTLSRLSHSLLSLASFASSTADTLSLLSSDLHLFLTSSSSDLPPSLIQLSKLTSSPEFTASLSSLTQSVTAGVLRATASNSTTSTSTSDRIINKLISPAGSGFASVVVGSFARNLVLGFYSSGASSGGGEAEPPRWVSLICRDESRELIGECVERFVSTAVAVFLDRTADINTYDEIFAGMTNPKHGHDVRDLMVAVCNGAVETLIKTSHRVMTSSSSGTSSERRVEELSVGSERRSSMKEGSGWGDQISSTMAVPSNKRFVMDVTGRVTYETVRSFLEFLTWMMNDSARKSVSTVREEVVGRGLEVMRYISAKSMVILTVCIALCMNMLARTRVVMPA